MGTGRWDPDAWVTHSTTTASKSTHEIFTSSYLDDAFNPTKFALRESRDSTLNPTSNAIIIAADVSGSMGIIADNLIRSGIGTVFEEILKRAAAKDANMITDPQLLVMGIGDMAFDRAPVQATQFETDLVIAEQLSKIYLEHGGGGNDSESYDAAWYFAAEKTSIDCFDKRAKKGYLFTVGDENAPYGMKIAQAKKFFDTDIQADLSPDQLLAMAEEKYNVFHVIVEEGNYARRDLKRVVSSWKELLGKNVISLDDYTKLAEVVVSTIAVNEGMSAADVTKTWSGSTSITVAKAVSNIQPAMAGTSGGVVRL